MSEETKTRIIKVEEPDLNKERNTLKIYLGEFPIGTVDQKTFTKGTDRFTEHIVNPQFEDPKINKLFNGFIQDEYIDVGCIEGLEEDLNEAFDTCCGLCLGKQPLV